MGDQQRQEASAFVAFFSSFQVTRAVQSTKDLQEPVVYFEVLQQVDDVYFKSTNVSSTAAVSDNWVLKLSAFKHIYRLLTQYMTDVLHQPPAALQVPDLEAIAKDGDVSATLRLCRLVLSIAVQSPGNKQIINRIQSLSENDQHHLMRAIESIMSKLTPSTSSAEQHRSMTDDDHYYHLQSERSRILTEKETLEKVYQQLLEEHRSLQSSFDDVVLERNDVRAQLKELENDSHSRRNDRADTMLRAENDRLRGDIIKTENNLGTMEADLNKQTSLVSDLTRRVSELQAKADEATRLKDQIDEYRHAADKLQKTENVMEKYKKKLEETADLRRHVKSLEEQNASLVDKNASLEEEYRKVSAFKPLMDSYKSQISDLEAKHAARAAEFDAARYNLTQVENKLRVSEEERARDSEAMELYQERVRELELMSARRPTASAGSTANGENGEAPSSPAVDGYTEGESLDTIAINDVGDDSIDGLGGELDNARTGATMTDLKLQVRQLKRELQAARTQQADASRVLVLENLLEDAQRMKARYEADYLAAHREKLVLQSQIEEIRSGKALGDGAEAAIALRQRLNETVDELEFLKLKYTELIVQHEHQSKDLTIIKSDLNLVNKDQLEILATLRESVNEDKVGLEADMTRLRTQLQELTDKNKMHLEQINGLLLDKISLQSEGIGQREKMLERERALGDMRSVISGRDLPDDIKSRLLMLHEENVRVKEEIQSTKTKLAQAKQFIKQQHEMFTAEHATKQPMGNSEEVEVQIRNLKEALERIKKRHMNDRKRFAQEQRLMLGVIRDFGMDAARKFIAQTSSTKQRGGMTQPVAWLGQRRSTQGILVRANSFPKATADDHQ